MNFELCANLEEWGWGLDPSWSTKNKQKIGTKMTSNSPQDAKVRRKRHIIEEKFLPTNKK
jgi:hypothetical protein